MFEFLLQNKYKNNIITQLTGIQTLGFGSLAINLLQVSIHGLTFYCLPVYNPPRFSF